MPAQTFLAKNYRSREDLEQVIRAEAGDEIDKNRTAGHLIAGKREELAKLMLDDTSSVLGVKCVISDTPIRDKVKIK